MKRANEMKNVIINGIWANPNYDDNKNTRQNAIDAIEENYSEILNLTYDKMYIKKKDEWKTNPFFAAMNVPDVPEGTPDPEPHDHKLDQDEDSGVDQM